MVGCLMGLVAWTSVILVVLWLTSCGVFRSNGRRVLSVDQCLDNGRACWATVGPDPRAGPGVYRQVLVDPEVRPGDCVCQVRGPVLRGCWCP